jgi:hypothetical protein
MSTYAPHTTIHYATGRHVTYATRDEAVEAIMATYPDAVVYDDGRTLVWRDEASARDDDGARAIAELVTV